MSNEEIMVDMARQLGDVAAQLKHLTTEVSASRIDIQDAEQRLGALEHQVKIANGRTSQLESKLEQVLERLGLLEAWRKTITFLPRILDRWAERPFWALPLTAAISVTTTIIVSRLLGS